MYKPEEMAWSIEAFNAKAVEMAIDSDKRIRKDMAAKKNAVFDFYNRVKASGERENIESNHAHLKSTLQEKGLNEESRKSIEDEDDIPIEKGRIF